VKRLLKIYIRFIQKILITILLTLLYFLVFSITKLIFVVFPGKHFKSKKGASSFWLDADGYLQDFDSSLEQS